MVDFNCLLGLHSLRNSAKKPMNSVVATAHSKAIGSLEIAGKHKASTHLRKLYQTRAGHMHACVHMCKHAGRPRFQPSAVLTQVRR